MKWEWKKIWTPGTLGVVLAIFCIHALCFAALQWNQRRARYEDYGGYLAAVDYVNASEENARAYLQAYRQGEAELAAAREELFGLIETMEPEEWNALYAERVVGAEPSWPLEGVGRNARLAAQLEHAGQYAEYRRTIGERMENALLLTHDPQGSYAGRNASKTMADFEKLGDIALEVGREEGVTGPFQSALTDAAVLLCLYLCCMRLMSVEYDRDLTRLLASMPRRGALFRHKLGALLCCAIFLPLVFYGTNLLTAHWVWGLGPASRAVQSIAAFRSCALPLSVGQYIALSLLFKVLCASGFGLLLLALLLLLRRPALVLAAAGLLCGAETLLYRAIPVTSVYNAWRFINLLAFRDSFTLFSQYQNVNLLGQPCSALLVCTVSIIALALLLGAVCCGQFVSGRFARADRRMVWWARCTDGLQRVSDRLGRHTCLLLHEGFKSLRTQKAAAILLALLAVLCAQGQAYEPVLTPAQAAYCDYLAQWEGPIDESMAERVRAEQLRLSQLTGDSAQLAQDSLEALALIEAQVQRQQALTPPGGTAYLVNPMGYQALLDRTTGLVDALLLAAALALLCSPLFPQERAMRTLLRTYPEGVRKTTRAKLLLALLYGLLVGALVYGVRFLIVRAHFPLHNWEAPLRAVEPDAVRCAHLRIDAYFAAALLLRLLGALTAALLAVSVSTAARSTVAALSLNLLLLVFPQLLSRMSAPLLAELSLYPLLSGHALLQSPAPLAGLLFPTAALAWSLHRLMCASR